MGPLGEYLESIENYIHQRNKFGPKLKSYDNYKKKKNKLLKEKS